MSRLIDRSTYDTNVPVVGAEPIGLTTTAVLGHHGVRNRVLEERTETKPYSGWVRPRLVLAAPGATKAELAAPSGLSDLDGRTHAAYGLDGHPALVLVRPDGHIAIRGPIDPPNSSAVIAKRCLGLRVLSRSRTFESCLGRHPAAISS